MKGNKFTVKLFDIYADDNLTYIFIIMEFLPCDLRQILNTSDSIQMDDEHALYLTFNLLQSINFLHSANLMHRDLKPGNILVDSNCNVKICDFGLSRTMPQSSNDYATQK